MAVEPIKAERVVMTALGLLERESVLAGLVWRDAAGDFRGAKDDTITIRVPAYAKANKRTLRSGSSRSKTNLKERGVDVTLADNLYEVVEINDEELTLDIEAFDRQVTAPMTRGIARGLEDEILDELDAPDYHFHHALDQDDPHKTIAKARRNLNDARVPMEGRRLIVGSAVEELLLTDPQFVRADQSGSTSALRDAQLGRIYNFPVFAVPGLDPESAYAFHRTAFVLNQRAPMVPRGAPWGATRAFEGFSIRYVQTVNQDDPVDQVHADVFVGTNHVSDVGTFDADGLFEPAEDPDETAETELFVRAVKIDFDGPPSS
ncbi:MAG: P22 phage major capsid protein family protein [Actinomycetota bacterium]